MGGRTTLLKEADDVLKYVGEDELLLWLAGHLSGW